MANKNRIFFASVFLCLIVISGVILYRGIEENDHRIYDETVYAASSAVGMDGLYSTGAFMVELGSGEVCFEKASQIRMPAASLTKLMTALVTVENISCLDSVFTFTDDMISLMEISNASVAGFTAGESVTARDMLYGALLPSGGDAALGLARLAFGGEEECVAQMNQKAENMGMTNTRFADVTGLDDNNSYTTASDMAMLFAEVIKNRELKTVLGTVSYLTSATPEHPNGILLKSTLSELYDKMPCITGGKTGYTPRSGLCLASCARIDGRSYILVTLGAGKGENYPLYHFDDAVRIYETYGKSKMSTG